MLVDTMNDHVLEFVGIFHEPESHSYQRVRLAPFEIIQCGLAVTIVPDKRAEKLVVRFAPTVHVNLRTVVVDTATSNKCTESDREVSDDSMLRSLVSLPR